MALIIRTILVSFVAFSLYRVAVAETCSDCRAFESPSLLQKSSRRSRVHRDAQATASSVASGSASIGGLLADPGTAAESRTLAINTKVKIPLGSGRETLTLMSAVPVLTNASESHIAMIFEYTRSAWLYVRLRKFRCQSLNEQINAPVEWFRGGKSYPLVIVGRCSWVGADTNTPCHGLDLIEEDEFGSESAIGRVQACHDPHLASEGPFRLVSCGRQRFDNPQNPELAAAILLPAWVEYNLRLGVEHFFWYTDLNTPPEVYTAMEPYFEEGVATRIHVASRTYDTHGTTSMNDCLYRAMHRADWIMPTIDLDEFLRPYYNSSNSDLLKLPDVFDDLAAKEASVAYITFRGFRFAKPENPLDLSVVSSRRQLEPQDVCPKYVARPRAMRTLFVHWPVSIAFGTELAVPIETLTFNHYRVKDNSSNSTESTLHWTVDAGLVYLAESLNERLRQRFHRPWSEEATVLLNAMTTP
eukprot:TRINITY_DN63647_c0_g1_i1.p1 TRINITY_DN63647_c0_g1~~TRINITY_DN63647_c0_g1_i1.p1  ORF type:complete len:472 (+),score=50.23 TRINITY_DN63647_c0_g1_i1:53-1468(+)